MTARNIQSREINQIVERQMRQWEIGQNEQARKQKQAVLAHAKEHVIDFITLSRELGSNGGQVAKTLDVFI